MSDLAHRFRAAREALGVSIDDAERITKIRRRYLEAIEAGDFMRLPDGPPSRGFIKNYASYLGLDAEQALTDFEAEVGVPITHVNEQLPQPPMRQQAVSRYTQLVKLPQVRWKGELPPPDETELDLMADDGSGSGSVRGLSTQDDQGLDASGRLVLRRTTAPGGMHSSFSLREPKVTQASDVRPVNTGKGPFSLRNPTHLFGEQVGGAIGGVISNTGLSFNASAARPLIKIGMIAAGVLVVLALIGFVVVPAIQGSQKQASATTTPQAITVIIQGTPQTLVTPNPGGGLATTPAANETADGTAAGTAAVADTPAPAGTSAPEAVQPLPGGGVQLVLDARERAWVRVKADGIAVYEGIPSLGPSLSWKGQSTIGIETGNAGAFDVILNGARIGPPGARNATVKITWDVNGKVISN
jgi:cytoskeletal protein RodZ